MKYVKWTGFPDDFASSRAKRIESIHPVKRWLPSNDAVKKNGCSGGSSTGVETRVAPGGSEGADAGGDEDEVDGAGATEDAGEGEALEAGALDAGVTASEGAAGVGSGSAARSVEHDPSSRAHDAAAARRVAAPGITGYSPAGGSLMTGFFACLR